MRKRWLAGGCTLQAFMALLQLAVCTPKIFAQLPSDWQSLPLLQLDGFVRETKFLHPRRPNLPLRQEIAIQIWGQYLADIPKLNAALKTDRYGTLLLIQDLVADLPLQDTQQISENIITWANTDGVLAGLSFSELSSLDRCLFYSRTPSQILNPMIARWVLASKQWQLLGTDDLLDLTEMFYYDPSADVATARHILASKIWDDAFRTEAFTATATSTTLTKGLKILSTTLSAEQMQELVARVTTRFLISSALANISLDKMASLVNAMRIAGASDNQVAGILVRWAQAKDEVEVPDVIENDESPERDQFLCLVHCAVNNSAFATEIIDRLSAPPPGPTASRLLAFAAIQRGSLAEWKRQINDCIANADDSDTKALWLLALANAEEVDQDGQPAAIAIKTANEAFALSEIERVRFTCIEWCATHTTDFGQCDNLQSQIRSAIESTSDSRYVHQYRVLEQQLRNQIKVCAAKKQHIADKAHAAVLGQLAFLEELLADAQAQHRSAEDVRSLELSIKNTRKQLTATTNESPK